MSACALGLFLIFTLPCGQTDGFFQNLINRKRSESNQGNNFDVCETVRVMPRIAMAVVGGAPVKLENSAPYIAAVGERIPNGSVSWFCGGSVISTHHVLTAAHCLVSRNVSTIRLGSFSTKKRSTENDYEVLDAFIHPSYKITESYNDIGILRVKNTITFDSNIKPVCLPQNDDKYERKRAKVIGWGAEEFGGEGSQKLQQVEVEVFTNANCEKAYQNSTIAPKTFPKGIKSEQLCAGSQKGGKDACQGDSGGPLVLTDEHGIVRLIGIVSTGAGCGFKMYPGVYTRVSSYTKWIQEQLKTPDSVQSPQKEYSSKENSNRRHNHHSKTQSQGSFLSSQSSADSRNKTRGKSLNFTSQKQTQNSKETYLSNSSSESSRKENLGSQYNRISETNSLVNYI